MIITSQPEVRSRRNEKQKCVVCLGEDDGEREKSKRDVLNTMNLNTPPQDERPYQHSTTQSTGEKREMEEVVTNHAHTHITNTQSLRPLPNQPATQPLKHIQREKLSHDVRQLLNRGNPGELDEGA